MDESAKFFEHPPQVPICEISNRGVNIRNIAVENMVIDIGTGSGPCVLGFGATFSNCEIRLHKRPDHLTVHGATFRNCRFFAKRKQEKLNWRNVLYENCSFNGVFRFCSPGFREAHDSCHPAAIRGCDFSEARLDYCSLGNADLESTVFPSKPHLVFFEPEKHRDAIQSIALGIPVQCFLFDVAFRDEQCSAVAYSVEFLSERNFPPDQFVELIRRCRELDFVRVNF